MKFLDAAIKILLDNDNTSMSVREIWEEISKQKLVETTGKTPWASLNTIILYGCVNSPIDPNQLKKEPERNKNIFDIIGKNPHKFKLNSLYLKSNSETPKDQPQPTTIIVPKEREIVYQLTCEELEWKCLTIYKDDDHLNFELAECPDYTYVFDDNTKLKIGRTSQENPIRRLDAMKTANPTIHIDIVFPSSQHPEKELHKRFDDSRMVDNREWFHKTKSLSKFIDEHKKKNEIALDWYHKQNKINEIEKLILNW